MREHRMKNQRILWENKEEKVSYFYRRNYQDSGCRYNPADIQVLYWGVVLSRKI